MGRAPDRIAGLLERYWYGIVSIWIALTAISIIGHSREKPLWADELLFRWIATSPGVHDIWKAVTLGINPDPPLSQLTAHLLALGLGSSPVVIRLPATIGFCVMLWCLALTLRIYAGAVYSLLGLVLPFCTILVAYSYEARPYGLLCGCLGVAIYCWAKAGDGRSGSALRSAGLGISLAAALACHFYAVFALPAFCLGEAMRVRRRGRVDWLTASAIGLAAATLVFYLPIAATGYKYSSAYFSKPYALALPAMLNNSLNQIAVPVFTFFVLVAVLTMAGVRLGPSSADEVDMPASSREFAALALGFLLIPPMGWIAGRLILKAFTDRYVLHGIIGIFLLLPMFARRVFGRNQPAALALLGACALPGCLFLVLGISQCLKPPDPTIAADNRGASILDLSLLAQALPKLGRDIVVSDPHLFMQMAAYSPALKARCIYLWDFPNEITYTQHDTAAHTFEGAARMGWFRAVPANSWSDYNNSFLFLTVPDGENESPGWLRDSLEAGGRYGEVIFKVGHYVLVTANPAKPLQRVRRSGSLILPAAEPAEP